MRRGMEHLKRAPWLVILFGFVGATAGADVVAAGFQPGPGAVDVRGEDIPEELGQCPGEAGGTRYGVGLRGDIEART